MSEDRVLVEFSQDEALVLFEWVAAYNELHDSEEQPTAEEYVLGNLEAALESQVNVVLSARYKEEHREAQARLQSRWVLDGDQPPA
ncbi:hypothetical protein JOE59_000983 [Agromyces cerinus]|uniref:hypothetical protein n=1 Tax=Agromyces cerinus TaxID=33878 RepID=UPI001958BEC0|nr:hypothetical protein [Agromyces cerinus]MBM7830278.1 hypothetical protein [Agromyces cerinus]